ncbi:hypothetical protein MUG94_00880 [Arthrobacter gengyunqii]|uniref:Uncharacterized protein n=1 Tax=Arthrobacter gengyunqii TaxID=2886940 RepID=A0A9X1M286_9MICC|nr:hypothetical protein [Arthrobacter gengyunqii]MCC3266301.1 hypothetical protein [Arthrobacter gengyunqii]MCC3269014.1 hypothetical protein [Arthrobacter gengyunqii]UOY96387.1 hypothetical protein MUG94_00880 [Arthrobacter gengyunqii]
MNELPEHDDVMIRRLLKESGVDESPELLEGLRRLRSFTATPAPVPVGELAELLSETAQDLSKRPPHRHRGLILSFTLAAAMAAGATGVAASTATGLRLTSESPAPAEVREAAPVQEDNGTDAESDMIPGSETPAAPEVASPETVSPEETAAASEPQTEADTAPDNADANLPAPPAPPADLSGPAAPDGSVPAPSAGAAPDPVPQPVHPEEADCEHGDGEPGAPAHRGKPELPESPGRDRGAGDTNRSHAGEFGRGGEPGRDTGDDPRHGGGENAGNHPRQEFSEGNRASGRP